MLNKLNVWNPLRELLGLDRDRNTGRLLARRVEAVSKVLEALFNAEKPLSKKEIARRSGVSRRKVIEYIGILERHGLVKRVDDGYLPSIRFMRDILEAGELLYPAGAPDRYFPLIYLLLSKRIYEYKLGRIDKVIHDLYDTPHHFYTPFIYLWAISIWGNKGLRIDDEIFLWIIRLIELLVIKSMEHANDEPFEITLVIRFSLDQLTINMVKWFIDMFSNQDPSKISELIELNMDRALKSSLKEFIELAIKHYKNERDRLIDWVLREVIKHHDKYGDYENI